MTKSKTNEFTKAIEDMMSGSFPDMSAFTDATKSATDFSAKLSKMLLLTQLRTPRILAQNSARSL